MTITRQVIRRQDSSSLADAAAFANESLLFRRDVTPAICYDDCNNAYKIAVSIGKNSALCARDSAFTKAYAACSSCIQENESDSEGSVRDYVEPEFAQFIEFCDDLATQQPGVSTTVKTVTNSAGPRTSVVVVTTIKSAEASTTPCTICVPLTYTDGTGVVATVMVKPDLQNLSRSQSSSPTSSADKPKSSGSNFNNATRATIIGPVVAVVVVILILLGALFFWRRHRSKKNVNTPEDPHQEEPKYEKAQLHSDCISRGPTYELQGSVPPPSSSTPSPSVAEMTANEVAAQELPTSQQKASGENDQTRENVSR
ncbi:hypothetical protein B0J13DRAFT_562635 [Dactylonectria estremocensis]|uniref:Uncharacterized protein n=1 Tax=Dactylonectria estremocensis TaxID=1079267 RepID=A0A9P9IUE4_9HYPO|nr:hypothetical protein B0J13DRAFT_562635 [Dactylonectria estremocensis]